MAELLVWPALIAYGEAAVVYADELRGRGRHGQLGIWGVRIGWLAQTALLVDQALTADGFPWGTWAGALNLLAGGEDAAFVRSARTLLAQGDDVLALKLLDLGLLTHPESRVLSDLRRHALDRLRTRYQNLNPFKFIVYSEWARADLASVD